MGGGIHDARPAPRIQPPPQVFLMQQIGVSHSSSAVTWALYCIFQLQGAAGRIRATAQDFGSSELLYYIRYKYGAE